MKKDLSKLAMAGILAGLCVSANASIGGKQIAMSKCSKDNTESKGSSCNNKSSCKSKPQDDSSCSSKAGCGNNNCDDNCSDEQSDASTLLKMKRKAAAEQLSQQLAE